MAEEQLEVDEETKALVLLAADKLANDMLFNVHYVANELVAHCDPSDLKGLDVDKLYSILQEALFI